MANATSSSNGFSFNPTKVITVANSIDNIISNLRGKREKLNTKLNKMNNLVSEIGSGESINDDKKINQELTDLNEKVSGALRDKVTEFYKIQSNISANSVDYSSFLTDELSINESILETVEIPEEFGSGGYTVTAYDDQPWVYNQKKMFDLWKQAGSIWDDGIATYEGRYLIACTSTFGDIGDKIDFYLSDGTKIPCIIADEKSQQVEAWDSDPANMWGHNDGQCVLEFEVSHDAFYNEHGRTNPGTSGWYSEWGGKRVTKADKLGSVFEESE